MTQRDAAGSVSTPPGWLLPPRLSRPLAVLAGLCALTAVLLGIGLRNGLGPSRIDVALAELVNAAFGPATRVSDELAELGKASSVAALTVLLSVVLAACGRPRFAALTVCAALAIPVVTSAGKALSGRELQGELSFPSGHAAGITAVATVLALFLADALSPRRRWLAPVAAAACVLIPVTVGLAVMVERFHYPTDVIGGWCVGVATTVGLALGFDLHQRRRGARPDGTSGIP